MKVEEAGEFFGMRYTPGPDGMSIQGAIALWGWSVLSILEEFRSELDPVQLRLAQDIIRCWGLSLPASMVAPGDERFVLSSEVPAECELFEEARSVGSVARAFRSLFAHVAENADRDERIIGNLQAFCDRTTDEMRSLAQQGDLTIGSRPYDTLGWHLRQLMYVALGDRTMERFIGRYDETMRRLGETARLAGAPKA